MFGWAQRVAVLGVAVALAAALAGCRPTRQVAIAVDHPDAASTTVIDIRVSGLPAGRTVTLRAEMRDGNGLRWSSEAYYVADRRGAIDLARDASAGGSYAGVHPMGLIATLTPDGAAQPGRQDRVEVTLSVLSGDEVLARTVIGRTVLARGVTSRELTVAADGVAGTYYAPPGGGRRPAVLAFGGSEGGTTVGDGIARALASAGYPALGIGYFGAPGLPATLAGVPLEYFGRALRFLAAQPGVDPRRIAVLGVSRGGEPAQLLAASYPDLVRGVVALVPADVAACGFPDCGRAAWTWQGRPVPFTRQVNEPAPTDVPAAVLPYARMRVPLFLACAGRDLVWDSCGYARAALAHHAAVHLDGADVLVAYPHAGHGVGDPVPGRGAGPSRLAGDGPTANEEAREQLWPRLLAFLAHLPG